MEAQVKKLRYTRAVILAWLSKNPGFHPKSVIKSATGFHKNCVKKALYELLLLGLVVKEKTESCTLYSFGGAQ
jgi:predicted transcriptional regulator